ncbi:hypothetical protein VTK26DRAFT_7919 [Humicola hyalothermophila]
MTSSASQTDASTDYWPIHIVRSDGRGYDDLDHNALNRDDDQDIAQLERWEVIVAGHLQNQIGPKDDKRQYKLAGFPKGYELRCAVRSTGTRDYYLYGHPVSSKANYRTPGEFALHALWLVSDSTDNSQCPCDLCPKYLEQRARSDKAQRERFERERMQQLNLSSQAPFQAAPAGPPANPAAQQFGSVQPRPAQQPPQQPQHQHQHQQYQPQQHQHQHPQQLVPQQRGGPPPGTTSLINVFRVGELVWYKHTAWRLGVILSIAPKPGVPIGPGVPDSHYYFRLAPLGHALLAQASLVKDSQSMRPFLTFSVPNTSIDELKDKTFDTVDWRALTARYSQDPDPAKKALNQQVLGLEASKMGARTINDAFSTFDLLADGTTPDGAFRVQHYAGIYLGAEMVRLGDPLRVTPPLPETNNPAAAGAALPPDATLIMLVSEIQVLTPTGNGAAHAAATVPVLGPTLQFRGHLYRTVRASAAALSTPGAVPGLLTPPEALGEPFVAELASRNAIEKDPSMRWAWVRVSGGGGSGGGAAGGGDMAVRGEQDVQGRFYVTERLMSAIDPGRLQSWVERGMLEEAPAYLNNRVHSGGGQFLGRRPNRAAMLGQAVSVGFGGVEGMVEN